MSARDQQLLRSCCIRTIKLSGPLQSTDWYCLSRKPRLALHGRMCSIAVQSSEEACKAMLRCNVSQTSGRCSQDAPKDDVRGSGTSAVTKSQPSPVTPRQRWLCMEHHAGHVPCRTEGAALPIGRPPSSSFRTRSNPTHKTAEAPAAMPTQLLCDGLVYALALGSGVSNPTLPHWFDQSFRLAGMPCCTPTLCFDAERTRLRQSPQTLTHTGRGDNLQGSTLIRGGPCPLTALFGSSVSAPGFVCLCLHTAIGGRGALILLISVCRARPSRPSPTPHAPAAHPSASALRHAGSSAGGPSREAPSDTLGRHE